MVSDGAYHADARDTEYGCRWKRPFARFNVLDWRCCCVRDWIGRRALEGSCLKALGQTSDALCPFSSQTLDTLVPMRLNIVEVCR